MVLDVLTNPWTLAIAGVLIGVLFMVLFGNRLAGWLRPQQAPDPQVQAAPQASVVTTGRRTLAGLSWVIAVTHRSVSQLIGLVMSFASLIAIVLSVISAVAGVALISYQQYGDLVLSLIASVATLILALLIENISINALKSIRLANEEISQAEQAHYQQIVKQMEEQFEEDAEQFAKIDQQNLSKDDVASMQRAANLKRQARKQFEAKRRNLMKQQTRNARHNRTVSIPFAAIGVLFSATAGGLFWHTVLASLNLWLNLTVGTMFALAVSVTFVQGELLKRIKDEAIGEALRSGEMQNVMLRQQSEEMVLEMVVDTMAAVKDDANTLQEMGQTIKEELKTTIRTLTKQTTSRLVESDDDHSGTRLNEADQIVLPVEEKVVARRTRKEPEWLSHPALSDVLKRYPKLNEKVPSWQATGRVSLSIVALINASGHSKRVIQNRIKDGTLKASSHNPNLVLIVSVIDWLRDADPPTGKNASGSQTEPITEITGAVSVESETSSSESLDTNPELQLPPDGDWMVILSAAVEALRANPEMAEAELAEVLGLQALGIVRFWKHKALEILAKEQQSPSSNGHVDLEQEVNLQEFSTVV